MAATQRRFFVTGGTLPADALSYVVRRADTELLQALLSGEYCYVLNSRQMGKSSLMVRTAAQLREDGVSVAVLDLTAIGQNLDAEQWYGGLLLSLAEQLDLEDALEDFWLAETRLGPLQRFMAAIRRVILPQLASRGARFVIFVDEIDYVRSLPFSTDEFFAAIRECYNRRTQDPEFDRLTFCLLGAATPADLIRDTRTSPFNVGKRIELHDFTESEAAPLARGLGKQGGELLQRVLYWTGGQPYLTQRLCQAVAELGGEAAPRDVDRLCDGLFLSRQARETDDNLAFVRNRILRSEADLAGLLDLYARIRRGRPVKDDEANPLASVLKVSGIVRARNGLLRTRNRIYDRVFDGDWIEAHMQDAELRRQRAAYRTGLVRAAAASGAIVAAMAVLAGFALHEANRAKDATQDARRNAARLDVARGRLQRTNQELLQKAVLLSEQNREVQRKSRQIAQAQRQTLQALRQANEQRTAALKQSAIAREQTRIALAAKQDANEKLRESYVERAHADRWSGLPGQRFQSLDALAKAAKMRPSDELRLKLRNEAIASLALPADLRLVKEYAPARAGTGVVAIDAGWRSYFRADEGGSINLCRASDGRPIAWLPGEGAPVLSVCRRSADGRYIAVWDTAQNVRIWDLRRQKLALTILHIGDKALDFSPDGRSVAYVYTSGMLVWVRLLDGAGIKSLPIPLNLDRLRFRPDGRQVVIGGYTNPHLALLDLHTGAQKPLPCPAGVHDVAWRPDGDLFAMCCRNSHVYICDPAKPAIVLDMEGHEREPTEVAFDHRGRLLATAGWDNTVRLWDPATGRQLLRTPTAARSIHFSPDDRWLVTEGLASSVWEIGTARECRSLQTASGAGTASPRFSPDGRLLAFPGAAGVEVWDAARATRLGIVRVPHAEGAAFTPDGRTLLTSGLTGVQAWRIEQDGAGRVKLSAGPFLGDKPLNDSSRLEVSADGETLAAIHQATHVHLLSLKQPARFAQAGYQSSITFLALSPDHRWLATSPWQGAGVKLWDARTGRLLRELPLRYRAALTFSPDGRWLVTCTQDDVRFWRVGTWQSERVLPRQRGTGDPGAAAFSPDGRLLAMTYSADVVRLIDPRDGTEVATLEPPSPALITDLRFDGDGSRLAVTRGDSIVNLWDLRQIRGRLAGMGLDWNLPAYPPAPRLAAIRSFTLDTSVSPADRESQYRQRIQYAERAVQANPTSVAMLNNLAWWYATAPPGVRDASKALTLIERAIQRSPDNWIFHDTAGVVYYRLNRWSDAIHALQESIRLHGGHEHPFDLLFMAMSRYQLGETEKAHALYEKAASAWNAQTDIAPDQADEWRMFTAEAQALIHKPPPQP